MILKTRVRCLISGFMLISLLSACEDITPNPRQGVVTPAENVTLIQTSEPLHNYSTHPTGIPSPEVQLGAEVTQSLPEVQIPRPAEQFRLTSEDATLSSLVLSSGALHPQFTPEVTQYKNIAPRIDTLTVSPTVNERNATVKIDGYAVASGSVSSPIPIGSGKNIIKIEVTAENGVKKDYSLEVYSNKGVVSTLSGSGSRGLEDGSRLSASFTFPIGVAVDNTGSVYVADLSNQRIRRIREGVVSTLAQSRIGNNPLVRDEVEFSPDGISVDSERNIYFTDSIFNSIRKVTQTGAEDKLAGGISGYSNATGAAAKFNSPSGIAVANSGTVYVADMRNHMIRKITREGEVTTHAGSGIKGLENGPGNVAKFSRPMGVAVDLSENVYVADIGNNAIRKITPNGTVSTLINFMNEATQTSFRESQALMRGIAVDLSGNVYVTFNTPCVHDNSMRMNFVHVIAPNGKVTHLAGTTVGHENGVGRFASFNLPWGIAVDSSGIVYVADTENNKIRKIE